MITGFDLIFLLCIGTATEPSDHCSKVHLQSDDGTVAMCTKLAPEIIADWMRKQGLMYEGYATSKWKCLPFGTSLGDDV